MATAQSLDERIAREYLRIRKDRAQRLADLQEPRYGRRELTPEEELRRWTYRDPSVDVDALRAQGLPETAIAALAFPLRVKLLRDAGRANDLAAQATYAQHMARRVAEAAAQRERAIQQAFGGPAQPSAPAMPPVEGT